MSSSQPSDAELAYMAAHSGDSMVTGIIICVSICLAVAYIAVGLRLLGRRIAGVSLRMNDWLILFALLLYTLCCASMYTNISNGLGKHVWLIADNVHKIYGFIVFTIVFEVTYILVLTTIKLSILSLYLQIFPQRWFRLSVYAVIVLTVIYGITWSFVLIFQCVPISSWWDPSEPKVCINGDAFVLVNGVWNILTDVVMLALPLPLLRKLQMRNNRRKGLITVFLTGGIVSVISAIRLHYAAQVGYTDPTWQSTDIFILSHVETAPAFLSACLPTYTPLLSYIFRFSNSSWWSGNKSIEQSGKIMMSTKRSGIKKGWSQIAESNMRDDTEGLRNPKSRNDAMATANSKMGSIHEHDLEEC